MELRDYQRGMIERLRKDLGMSAPASKVDVLAAINKLCTRYIANRGTSSQFICCVTPSVHGDDAELRKSDIAAAWLDLDEARAELGALLAFKEAAEFILAGRPEELRSIKRHAAALAAQEPRHV